MSERHVHERGGQLVDNATRSTDVRGQETAARGEKSPVLLRDNELVARARDGDHWASEELVRLYQQKAYAVAYSMCAGDSEEARDLTQEAFLRAFRNLRRFRGDSSFYTWFYRIVANTCLDSRRRRSRWNRIFPFRRNVAVETKGSEDVSEEHPDTEEHSNPMTALSGKELSQEIETALAALPNKQRLAFQLKVLHGMNIREIAEIMQAAEGTVKSHLFRATQFLRQALKHWAET